MKRIFALSAVAIALTITGCNSNSTNQAKQAVTITEQSSDAQKAGYALGFDMGQNAKTIMTDLDLAAVQQGLKDAYDNKKSPLTEEQMATAVETYVKKKMEEKVTKNKTDGEAWLAENAKKEGVQTTASGLQYKVITEGSGESPKATDKVVVHYEGKLIDGTIFDSSYERGEPVEFPLDQVIAGWTEGLQLMKPNGVYELYVPSNLGYGETGNQNIEPNSVLIFKIELLDEKSAKAAKEQAKANQEAQMQELIKQMQSQAEATSENK